MKFGNENYIVGIIGFGFVGKAIQHGFAQTTDFRIYDINPLESTHSFEEVVTQSDFIFICVPTPTDFETGKQDNYIMDGVIEKCVPFVQNTNKVLILKSTIVPGTTQAYINKYPGVRIVFNPEFLTERTFRLDFINQSRIIIGGNKEDTEKVEKLYRLRFPSTPICRTTATVAELVKYFGNCFFAAKVSIFNEFYQICQALNLDYQHVMELVIMDGRIGNSHWKVPGVDGKAGFSGSCFPKDINALIAFEKQLGIVPTMMEGAWKKNLEVRPEQDWLHIRQSASKKKKEK